MMDTTSHVCLNKRQRSLPPGEASDAYKKLRKHLSDLDSQDSRTAQSHVAASVEESKKFIENAPISREGEENVNYAFFFNLRQRCTKEGSDEVIAGEETPIFSAFDSSLKLEWIYMYNTVFNSLGFQPRAACSVKGNDQVRAYDKYAAGFFTSLCNVVSKHTYKCTSSKTEEYQKGYADARKVLASHCIQRERRRDDGIERNTFIETTDTKFNPMFKEFFTHRLDGKDDKARSRLFAHLHNVLTVIADCENLKYSILLPSFEKIADSMLKSLTFGKKKDTTKNASTSVNFHKDEAEVIRDIRKTFYDTGKGYYDTILNRNVGQSDENLRKALNSLTTLFKRYSKFRSGVVEYNDKRVTSGPKAPANLSKADKDKFKKLSFPEQIRVRCQKAKNANFAIAHSPKGLLAINKIFDAVGYDPYVAPTKWTEPPDVWEACLTMTDRGSGSLDQHMKKWIGILASRAASITRGEDKWLEAT